MANRTMTNDPVLACAGALITLGRGYRDGDEDERSDIDRDDYARKCAQQTTILLEADSDHLAQAIERLTTNGDALAQSIGRLFVADAIHVLARIVVATAAMEQGFGTA